MSRAILVVNSGSATVKYAFYDEELRCLARGIEEGETRSAMLGAVLRKTSFRNLELIAAGHRVVHGGDKYAAPIEVNAEVLKDLDDLCPLAPLHQPHNLAGIHAVLAERPGLSQVACFDTAFHQTQPPIARMFALPRALHDEGIKRYGFHGLSYEYVARKLQNNAYFMNKNRIIVAHLGNGSSLCALKDFKSVASTMGFTALDGLMMGTRTGTIDPGVLLYLMEAKRMTARELERLLYNESGLLGVSGISHDMRTLLASQDPRARLAIDLYVYRAVREIGSLAAALGGLDALVFTGGIGERAAPVRDAIVEASRWLGEFSVSVVPTNEEEMIARHVLELNEARDAAACAA